LETYNVDEFHRELETTIIADKMLVDYLKQRHAVTTDKFLNIKLGEKIFKLSEDIVATTKRLKKLEFYAGVDRNIVSERMREIMVKRNFNEDEIKMFIELYTTDKECL